MKVRKDDLQLPKSMGDVRNKSTYYLRTQMVVFPTNAYGKSGKKKENTIRGARKKR